MNPFHAAVHLALLALEAKDRRDTALEVKAIEQLKVQWRLLTKAEQAQVRAKLIEARAEHR